MNHLESTFSGKNSFWRYFIMCAVILLAANTIGSLPLLIVLYIKSGSNPAVFSQFAASQNNFSAIGINPILGLILMIFPFIAGLITFIILVKPFNNRSFNLIINGTRRIRWNRYFISGFVWLIISALYFFFYLKLDPGNFTLNNQTNSLITLTIISFLFIPLQAGLEEMIFRGYLMQGFAAMARNRWFPLIMTSALFGLLHAYNPEVKEYGFLTMIPQYITFGLIFGIITLVDDGIEASMGAHTANNIFLCIMVTSRSSALQTPALYEQSVTRPWTEFAALIVSGIIFIIILKIIFRWEDFSVLFKKIEV